MRTKRPFLTQVYENYKRMFVPEGKPEVDDDKEPLRATVFYHVVQVSQPYWARSRRIQPLSCTWPDAGSDCRWRGSRLPA